MGSLSNELAMTILRNFSATQLIAAYQWEEDLQARASKPPVWNWAPGTYVFPEALCCYCGGVMAGPTIFRAVDLQYYGSWKVVRDSNGEGYFVYDDTHPHVHEGSICMGSNYRASSVADALFLAFNPLSSYFGMIRDGDTGEVVISTNDRIKDWFADRFDHRCGEGSAAKAIEGVDLRHVVAAEDGCFCSNCRMHRGDGRCGVAGCGQWYDRRKGHGEFQCSVCNFQLNLRFCIEHKHDQKECDSCSDFYDLYNPDTGTLYAEVEIPIAKCKECQRWLCEGCEDGHSCGPAEDDDPDWCGECSNWMSDCECE